MGELCVLRIQAHSFGSLWLQHYALFFAYVRRNLFFVQMSGFLSRSFSTPFGITLYTNYNLNIVNLLKVSLHSTIVIPKCQTNPQSLRSIPEFKRNCIKIIQYISSVITYHISSHLVFKPCFLLGLSYD